MEKRNSECYNFAQIHAIACHIGRVRSDSAKAKFSFREFSPAVSSHGAKKVDRRGREAHAGINSCTYFREYRVDLFECQKSNTSSSPWTRYTYVVYLHNMLPLVRDTMRTIRVGTVFRRMARDVFQFTAFINFENTSLVMALFFRVKVRSIPPSVLRASSVLYSVATITHP